MPRVAPRSPASRRLTLLLAGLALVGASLTAPPVTQTAQAAQTCTSVPFKSSKRTHKWYRVPSVVGTGGGRVIAFAERRDRPTTDDGNFDIVMRVSSDNGCHWGSLRVVSNNGKKRVSNPVPVNDPYAGKVVLLTTVLIYNPKTKGYVSQLHSQRMNLDGSGVTQLSKGLVRPEGWVAGRAMGNSGPGHGVVLRQGTHRGRIIVPLSRRESSTDTYFLYSVYSDDHGSTWHVGYYRSAGKRALIEGSIAEAPDGRLLVTYREKKGTTSYTKPGKNRVLAASSDGGKTVTPFRTMSGVKTVPVFGSLLTTTGAKSIMLFSSPDLVNAKRLSSRRGMRIFVSTNSGANWHGSVRIGAKTASAGYSDLVQLNDTTVGIAYEDGYSDGWKQIRFTQVALSRLK